MNKTNKNKPKQVLMTFGDALKNPDVDLELMACRMITERQKRQQAGDLDEVSAINAQLDMVLEALMERAAV